jgi:glycerol uptake facilitator-like aquaporin
MGGGSFGQSWIYLVGPLLGGWAAAVVFRTQNPGD